MHCAVLVTAGGVAGRLPLANGWPGLPCAAQKGRLLKQSHKTKRQSHFHMTGAVDI
jgi:hypothetical protein